MGTYPKSENFSTMSEDPESASKSRWKSGNHPKKSKYGQSTALQTQYPLFTIGYP
jgi:hypothetical protein